MKQSDKDFLRLIDGHIQYASKAASPHEFEKLYRKSLGQRLTTFEDANTSDITKTSNPRILSEGIDLLVFSGLTDKKNRRIADACNLRLERKDGAIQVSCKKVLPHKYANMILFATLLLGTGVVSWLWTTTAADFLTLVPAGYLSGYLLGWIASKTFDHSYRIHDLIRRTEGRLMSSGTLSLHSIGYPD